MTVKIKSPAETNPELNKKVVESVKDLFNDTANRPKEILNGVREEFKKRAEENPFRASEIPSNVRFSVLRFIKLIPKWYSKKTWSVILSLSAILIGAIIFAFAKFGIIPGIVTWVVSWGVTTFFWNRWWKKNSTEFVLNISSIVERCMVDKNGNPVYVD